MQKKAEAWSICPCDCNFACSPVAHGIFVLYMLAQHAATRLYFDVLMTWHEWWLEYYVFDLLISPPLHHFQTQITTLMANQMFILGGFFDASNQLETQQLFARLTAKAHKDYRVSVEMCTFGTNVRALAATDRNVRSWALFFSKYNVKRQTGALNNNAAQGPKEDREGRLALFKQDFCDKDDNNRVYVGDADTGFATICADADFSTRNKDVDFTNTVALPKTLDAVLLDVDIDDGLHDDERNILALQSHLYGHDVFTRPTRYIMEIEKNQGRYMDLRSVLAKRSVAQNSFDALVAMKARGPLASEDTAGYMGGILQELGLSTSEVDAIIGERPSYLAQMEVLAKKIYQNPEFYVGLYDSPVNVRRKSAAMQAIKMMLDRDIYESYMRSEAIMSVLLETRLLGKHDEVENRLQNMEVGALAP